MSWLLYIDDDPDDRALFIEVCEEVHPATRVFAAESANEAFVKLEETAEPPICIYIDVNMPIINGIEALRKIKTNPKFVSVPTFILSTSKTPALESEAKKEGAVDYIIKPSHYGGFLSLLRSCFLRHYPQG
jgi:CheY-like chemotaxis protein